MIAHGARSLPEVSERDWSILEAINQFHFLTTRQLARSMFDADADAAIPRRVNHAMTRLRRLGLVVTLERRIGGVRAGSAGYVWSITDAGRKAVAARRGDSVPSRLRQREPSTTFLAHMLAVAECALVAQDGAQEHGFTLAAVDCEPDAWRTFLGPMGMPVRLKPDLALVVHNGDFEDRWFIEVDLDTEPPSRVITKCLAYERYRATGLEQQRHDVFPAVLWVVPSERRATQLRTRIEAERRLAAGAYTVATFADVAQVLRDGPAPATSHTGGQRGDHSP